jgi:hypothetical protein
MIANLDSNTGRLLAHLGKLGIERDTMLIFMTDNGAQQRRFNAGLRGLKGTTYDGGIRVPCFLRQPGVAVPREVDQAAAHVDLMPTILDACRVAAPKHRKIDGRSLMPWIKGSKAAIAERSQFFQWHRGDEPEAWKSCAVVRGDWKLVNGAELYNVRTDPAESRDLAGTEPAVVARLRKEYEDWFADVGSAGYAPPRIWIGSEIEDPVLLTRQDWRGPKATWDATGLGHYEVDIRRKGRYRVTLKFPETREAAKATFDTSFTQIGEEIRPGSAECSMETSFDRVGPARFEGRLEAAGRTWGAHYIEIRRLG